jgi:hypothetical protein
LRGGSDNITVLVLKLGKSPDGADEIIDEPPAQTGGGVNWWWLIAVWLVVLTFVGEFRFAFGFPESPVRRYGIRGGRTLCLLAESDPVDNRPAMMPAVETESGGRSHQWRSSTAAS